METNNSRKSLRKTVLNRKVSVALEPKMPLRKPVVPRILSNTKTSDSATGELNPKLTSSREVESCEKSETEKRKISVSANSTELKKGKQKKSENDEISELENSSNLNIGDCENDHDPDVDNQSEPRSPELREAADEFNSGNENIEMTTEVEDIRSNSMEDNDDYETDAESTSGNCLDGILKGFNKDIGALYTKTNSIESELKEIKRLLKSRPTQHCAYRSLSSQFKENSTISLLPKFPLLKKSEVRKMENYAEENEDYKSQLVSSLSIDTPKKFALL